MKFSTFIIALLTSSSVLSQTVIYYEDGTAYTLKDNEHVYVSKARQVYQKKTYDNGNVYFCLLYTSPSPRDS